jgi:hypothetical protein
MIVETMMIIVLESDEKQMARETRSRCMSAGVCMTSVPMMALSREWTK